MRPQGATDPACWLQAACRVVCKHVHQPFTCPCPHLHALVVVSLACEQAGVGVVAARAWGGGGGGGKGRGCAAGAGRGGRSMARAPLPVLPRARPPPPPPPPTQPQQQPQQQQQQQVGNFGRSLQPAALTHARPTASPCCTRRAPVGRQVGVGNHDGFQVEAAVRHKHKCVVLPCRRDAVGRAAGNPAPACLHLARTFEVCVVG